MTLMPAIDYTNKDYSSLRRAMLDLARYRLPEWSDQSPADLGVLLVDLFAYMGDVILYYQDRIASELFLETATERRSVMRLLRLVGYELAPPTPAAAELNLYFRPPTPAQPSTVVIPRGAQFASRGEGGAPPLTFEYLGPDLSVDLTSPEVVARGDRLVYAGLPVREGRAVPSEIIGSSTGEPNQRFALSQFPLIAASLELEVNEGAGWVRWEQRESLVYYTGADGRVTVSSPEARDYTVEFDEHDLAWVVFGDGVYGRRPPVGLNNIRATYSIGGGAAGNVAADTIVQPRTSIPQLDRVANPLPAAGGADRESLEHAVRFGPLAFRSGQRAVTLDDVVTLAHQAGGVARATAEASGWNTIDLYIAPTGETLRPVPEGLSRRLLAFFEDRRIIGTELRVLSASPAPIELTVEVVPDRRYLMTQVLQSVEQAVRNLLAFANVNFGQSVYLSDIYGAVENIPGVVAATVSRFRRQDGAARRFEDELSGLALPSVEQLPEFLQRAIMLDVVGGGRIEVGPHAIPVIGDLIVREARQ